MSKRIPSLLIEDIVECANKIIDYTSSQTFDEFMNDQRTVDAVIRNFEVIGEAANRLPDEFKEKNEIIDWHKIRGFRNRIIHDYMGIDYVLVWEIRNDYLPILITELEKIK
jgi:uncharacterized protein with HEPN domain